MNELKQLSGDTFIQTSQKLGLKLPNKEKKPTENPLPQFNLMSFNTALEKGKQNISSQKKFFGDLITHGDLTILFGKSNTGKSFLAYQIAEAIVKGINILDVIPQYVNTYNTTDYNLNNENTAQKVLYLDFEGTEEQNYRRYSNDDQLYKFSDNLFFAYPERLSDNSTKSLFEAVTKLVKENNFTFVIIDNLTAVSAGMDSEKANNAAALMQRIKDFQRVNKISVLVLAHTPKIQEGKLITENDLAGSANIYNLADSVLAINTTGQDQSIRYIKQLKNRYNEKQFTADNVICLKFTEQENGFKGYEFISYESEYELVKVSEKYEIDEENDRIIYLYKKGESKNSIAKTLFSTYSKGVNEKTYLERIKKKIQRMIKKGLIESRLTANTEDIINDNAVSKQITANTEDIINSNAVSKQITPNSEDIINSNAVSEQISPKSEDIINPLLAEVYRLTSLRGNNNYNIN